MSSGLGVHRLTRCSSEIRPVIAKISKPKPGTCSLAPDVTRWEAHLPRAELTKHLVKINPCYWVKTSKNLYVGVKIDLRIP